MILDIILLFFICIPAYIMVQFYESQNVKPPQIFVNSEKMLVVDYYIFQLYMVTTLSGDIVIKDTSTVNNIIMHKFGQQWRSALIFKKEKSMLQGERNHAVFLIVPLFEQIRRLFMNTY